MVPVMNTTKVLLTAVLLGMTLVSCEQNSGINESQNKDPESTKVYSDESLSKYSSPIDITFVRETGDSLNELIDELPGETLEDNRWSRLYESVLGIRIKYNWLAEGEHYYKKLGVMLASGNLPDVVRVNAQQLRQLSNEGLIQDLTDAYEEYASPITNQIYTEEISGTLESAIIDGKLMAIPDVDAPIEKATFIWIRTDWLNQLGLQPPQTMNDVLHISKAFTEQDPDQNSTQDTYGLAATFFLWDPVMGLRGFMAGYNAYPDLWLKDPSGKLVYGGIQPEVKQGLKVLQEMYRQGQFDSEFMFKDGSKVKQDIANGKIGMIYGEQWASFVIQSSRTNNLAAEWQAYPIVSASTEPPKVPLKLSTNQFLAVRKGYSHPEAIVKMINLHLEKNWGKTAEYETYYNTLLPVWQLSPITPFPPMKNLEAYRQLAEARQLGNPSILQDEAKFIQKKIDNYHYGTENRETGWGWEKTYGPTGAMSVLDAYEKNDQLLYDSFIGAPTETMIDKQTILDNLLHDTYTSIILGDDISEFDRFVKEWLNLGGEKITVEVNQWYSERGTK